MFEELEHITGLIHAFSSRRTDAVMKDAKPLLEVAPEKQALLDNLGITREQLILLRQTHSDKVAVIENNSSGEANRSPYPADGAILLGPGRISVIKTADCLPIVGVLERQRKLCALHAGWRGTRDRIAAKGMEKFLEVTGADPHEVMVALGPCIRSCCYEVGPEVKAQYAHGGHNTEIVFKGRNLDLIEANLAQLCELGITRVLDSGMCTACRTDLFYSYRREGTTGRLWAIAGFRD